jgi:preprotein translocase subunit SecB
MAENGIAEGKFPFLVHIQYLKDLSLENPNPLAHLTDQQETKPEISINIQVNAKHLTEKMFEVVLEINADAKRGEDKMFVCQVQYAALITINDTVDNEHVRSVLLEKCPEFIFPFARNVVADATRETGFMPLLLQPVDFSALNKAQQEADLARQNDGKEQIN